MRWCLGLLISLIWAGSVAAQETSARVCEPVTPQCVLEAVWGAAVLLPEAKQARLHGVFLEIVDLTQDDTLKQYWRKTLNYTGAPPHSESYPDFGWQLAEPILEEGGIDGLISLAESRAEPLNFGRADALFAAGRRLRLTRPTAATRINLVLLSLIRQASRFEQPILAHAAAELAMQRCDQDTFAKALQHTAAPNSLRYAFWQARLSGSLSGLPERIRADAIEDDTRHVRQALDGYRSILELGFCLNDGSNLVEQPN